MQPSRATDLLKLAAIAAGIAAACLWLVFGATGCSPREIPSDAPKPTLRVWLGSTGKSMLPTFPERSLVELEIGVPFEALKQGDTVVYWDYKRGDTALTHHRLVAKQGGNWIAQGDNRDTNREADQSWVTRDNYIGRTTGRHVQLLTAP